MKKSLVIIFLSISSLAFANKYYVSTSGNNANNGLTTTTPWQTIQYAEAHAIHAGDIIALKRGDTWSTNIALGIHHGGTYGNKITWDGSLWGSGANAVIKSSGNRTGSNISIVNIIGCSYVTFQNITVNGNNTYAFGLVIGGTDNMYSPGGKQNGEKSIIVQNCSILNCGNGINYTLGLLCQTWHNNISDITIRNNTFNGADDEQLSFYGGKSADGGTPAECKNVYIGYNTLTNWGRRGQSTGYGLQLNNKITNVTVENNILTTGIYGHGNAFQIESNESLSGWFPTGVVVRYNKISATPDNTFCLYITQGQAKTVDVYYNQLYAGTKTTNGGGIWVVSSASPSWTGAKLNFYNNTIYSLSGRSFTNDCATTGVVTLKNNLFYNAGTDDYGMMCLVNNTAGTALHSNNLYYRSANVSYTKIKDGGSYEQTNTQVLSWESTAKATDPLFVTPGTDFHLQSGSPAIGSGTAITGLTKDLDGVTFTSLPGIGCYQNNSGLVLPVYKSSAIGNATPSVLDITYDQSLANIIPAVSSFIVQVNSVNRTVNSVAVSGTKVSLTLANAVVSGDVVTVAYTKPAINQLQTLSGGQAASFSAQPVTNNLLAVSPVYVSSAVPVGTPSTIEMTYNLSLANIVPAVSAFGVLVNSVNRTVNSIAVSGTKVSLTLASAIAPGDIATVAYTKPAINPLQTLSGGQAASISSQPVSIPPATGTNKYYVSTSGNNANDGLTTTTPWQTIQYAETRAIHAGDIIALKRGDTWLTNIALGIHHGGTSGNPVIWDGSLWGSGANAIIQSSSNRTGSNISIVNIIGCSYVTFQNITVNGNNTYAFGLVIGGTDNMYSGGGVQNAEQGITVQNCSVLNCGNGINYTLGLLCQTWHNNISDITIRNNTFDGADDEQLSFYGGKSADGGTPAECKNVYIGYNTLTNWGRRGQSTGYGLQLNNKITNVTVENNILTTGIYGHGNAFQIESNESLSGWFPTGVVVRYNKITATPDNTFCLYITQGQAKTVDVYYNQLNSGTKTTNGGGIWVVSSASPLWTGAKLNFYNNTIYSLSGRSFTNDCAVAGVVTLKNNLFYNSGTDDYGMMCLVNNTAGTALHSNNLYYRSANVSYTKIKDGGSYQQTNTQVLSWESTAKATDPLFVTPGTDFHLQSGSPAIGSGTAITGLTKDLDGVTVTGLPNIGCYQAYSTLKSSLIGSIVSSDKMKMTIYPNPARSVINISIQQPDASSTGEIIISSRIIRVFDISGKLVLEKLINQGDNNIQVLLNLGSGVYIVQLVSDGLILSAKKLLINN